MANSSSSQLLILPDILGLFVLAVQLIILFRWLIPDDGFRLIYGVLAYIVLAALALYAWRGKRVALKVSKPAEWAATVGASVLLGAVSFGIDVVLESIHNPGLSPLRAGTRAGSAFGFRCLYLFVQASQWWRLPVSFGLPSHDVSTTTDGQTNCCELAHLLSGKSGDANINHYRATNKLE